MAELLTVQTVAGYLGIDDYADDASTIEDMIGAAQAVIERYARRSLDANRERTEYYDVSGMDFYAREAPITEIVTLTDDAQYSERAITLTNVVSLTNDNGENYGAGKVELWKDEGGFSGGRLNVLLNYRAGWTTGTLPADLRQAWIDLVVFWWNNPERVGIAQAIIAGENIQWEKGEIPHELVSVFLSYRLAGDV